MRHGCATFLLAKGVPDRVIMEVLGHAEIGVTMNTYAHVLPVLRQEAADAIDELFGALRERLWLLARSARRWRPVIPDGLEVSDLPETFQSAMNSSA